MSADSPSDDFFVAYLPTPPRLRRHLMAVSATVVALAFLLAVLLAALQHDPGPARWAQTSSEIVGVLRHVPYPFLELEGENRRVLLVRPGKLGLAQLPQPDGQIVRVQGTRLERAGLLLLEVGNEGGAITAVTDLPGPASNLTVTRRGDPTRIRGQIVDPKCFGGAMKPGAGKTHKGCAVLCLRGGIPPVFVVAGSDECLVLTDATGQPFHGASLDSLLPFVADPVELTGQRTRVNGLATLRVDPMTICRL